MTAGIKKIVFFCMLAMIAVIGALHYFTPGHYILFHDTFRRLAYFPIAIGAILYGLPGGIATAVLACVFFVPHLLVFWYQGPQAYYSELSEIVFYLAAGVVIGFISSRENRLQEKYRKMSEKLSVSYQRLHHQAGRLLEAETQLGRAKKMSELGQLSASLAHEIKNPLASIKGAAEILADEVPEGHPRHEFIAIMGKEIDRLNRSVEEVLAYCKGQQPDNEITLTAASRIIDKVVQLLDPELQKKSIALVRENDTRCRAFQVEESAVTQVVLNLVLNAIDAVEKKGMIRIKEWCDDKGYGMEVADNGPGIDADQAKDIFTAFVSFKQKGTGLGLPITRKIIQRLGGSISMARSDLGGAAFLVILPKKNQGLP